jgi:hypothetical protein
LWGLPVNAGSNKAATSATGLNTKKLDDETEVLARKCCHPTPLGILFIENALSQKRMLCNPFFAAEMAVLVASAVLSNKLMR